MGWQQLIINTTKPFQEAIEDKLIEFGALSISLEDAANQPILEPDLYQTPLWDEIKMAALFDLDIDLQAITVYLYNTFHKALTITSEKIADQDWVRITKDQFHPIKLTDNLTICPSWHDAENQSGITLFLDPGLAFGTGSHPTTALCLKQLDQHDLTNKTIIDFGCGSGIIAIAAVLLGAKSVIAIDNDPQAVQATQDNAHKNHIDQKQLCASLNSNPENVKADILIANILATPLINLASEITNALNPEGTLILSGILSEQCDAVIAAYPSIHFSPTINEKEWVCLEGIKIS